MRGKVHQYCPICLVEVYPDPRYPRHVCAHCAERAADEIGRPLGFFNESIYGGFIAKYLDTGEKRGSHVCYIDGAKCWADEARFGGIVIESMGDPVPRRV